MSYKWKQIKKDLDIGDKKYNRSDQKNYIFERKMMVFYKFINIWITKVKTRQLNENAFKWLKLLKLFKDFMYKFWYRTLIDEFRET